jgi:hypothetical protein
MGIESAQLEAPPAIAHVNNLDTVCVASGPDGLLGRP